MADIDDVEVELRRIVDRLTTMPLTRVDAVVDPTRDLGLFLVEATRSIGGDIPPDAIVPRLGATGLGAMIAVLGRDYLDAVRASDEADDAGIHLVLDRLVVFRKSLP